ncbi:MAG: HAD-IA family hydrolase [Burkholderiales bacterium]|nr:HAD-IA family hydrolase [Burkholderiales bacterium]
MSIEALIFDVDGTLADTEEIHRQAFNAAFQEARLWWNWSPHQYAELLPISGGKERIAAYVATLDQPEAAKRELLGRIGELHRAKTRIFTSLIAGGRAPLRPGVARLIREARDAGLKLAIASTTTPANVEALLETHLGPDAPRWFAVIAAGDKVPMKKPAPDIYDLALAVLGLAPEVCIAFEDSAKGLAAAKAAGLFTVVTPTFWTRTDDLAAADLLLPSLGDPDAPLDPAAAAALGAPCVGLAALERVRAGRTARQPA